MLQVLFIVILASLVFTYFYVKRPSGSLPGPLKFPFLGSFPQIALEIGRTQTGIGPTFLKWSIIYGPIFSVDFASYPAIILNSGSVIRQAFAIPQLSGRPRFNATLVRTEGHPRGLIFNEEQSWVEQRRFTMRHLKDFGVGKNESLILDEVQDLLKTFRKHCGEAITTDRIFNVAIINILWAIVAGQRFEHDDPKLQKLVKCVNQNLGAAGGSGAMLLFPRLTKMFPTMSGWNAYLEAFNTTRAFIRQFVENRMRNYKDGHRNDFTDVYIEQIKKTTNSTSSFYKEEGVKNLIITLDDLFNAGGETTSTMLTWFLLCLAVNPDVQRKFQAEIDNVIGRGRLPSLSDRPGMVYTNSIISEVLRISTIVPVGVLHSALEDTMFQNTLIPKNTIVISNLYGVHHDPEVWKDPSQFSPERFLTSPNLDAFLPFSAGRRVCPGETLARDEIFLMVTSIFQEFEIRIDPLSPIPSLVGHCQGVVTKPQKHKVIFHKR